MILGKEPKLIQDEFVFLTVIQTGSSWYGSSGAETLSLSFRAFSILGDFAILAAVCKQI